MRRISEQSLMNAAVFYLRRYAASRRQLQVVLARKVKRVIRAQGGDLAAALPLIDAVLERVTRAGYLDDARLAETKSASLQRQGKSQRMIRLKLRQKGLAAEVVARASAGADDASAALTLARRRKLGVYGPAATRAARQQKDLGVLLRAGFTFAHARQALRGEASSGDGAHVDVGQP